VDDDGTDVQSFVMTPDTAPPAKVARRWGNNQKVALLALREWSRSHQQAQLIETAELHELLKAQGIGRQRRHEVVASLAGAGVLTASIGGHALNREALR
jgi:hypothetical protein